MRIDVSTAVSRPKMRTILRGMYGFPNRPMLPPKTAPNLRRCETCYPPEIMSPGTRSSFAYSWRLQNALRFAAWLRGIGLAQRFEHTLCLGARKGSA